MPKSLWRGRASSPVLTWLLIAIFSCTFAFIVVINHYASGSDRISGAAWLGPTIIMVVGTAVSLWTSSATVEVSSEEFRVRFGPGWPSKRIPWDRVATVEVTPVRFWDYGGWGYKVRPLAKTSALVLRSGDGLKLTLDNGRAFVVTVDGAKKGLDVIRRILAEK